MKYFTITLSLLFTISALLGSAKTSANSTVTPAYQIRKQLNEERFSDEALREDFMQMRQILEENHAALYEYTPKKVMDSLMDHSYSLIRDSMSLSEFFVLLTPVISRIGCGHTNVWMPMSYWKQNEHNLFPLRIRLIDDLVVVAGTYSTEVQIPRGSVLLEINDRAVSDIIQEMMANYPADAMNGYFIQKAVERRFPMIYARRFGFPEEYRVTYTLPGSHTRYSKVLVPATNEEVRSVVFRNFKNPELSLTILEDKNTAVMRIETFIYYDKVSYFTNFIDSSFNVIYESKLNNLILDLRGNDGGDPFCSVPLFSYLEPEPLPYFAEPYRRYAEFAKPIPRAEEAFDGNLLVLIDGRCFSTNGHFCALLKHHEIGTFIGTPSGATYTCNAGNNTHAVLNNTKIMLWFGRSSFAAAVSGMDKTQPIYPDIHTNETYQDFLENRDVFMEKALDQVNINNR